jgi:predicted phage tail protein
LILSPAFFSLETVPNRIAIPEAEIRALTHIAVGSDLIKHVIYNDDEQRREAGDRFGPARRRVRTTMRIIEIAIGIILLGGAAWTTVRTYKGRGISSIFVLAFAVFLVTLGLSFLFGAFGELVRNLRFGSEWLK